MLYCSAIPDYSIYHFYNFLCKRKIFLLLQLKRMFSFSSWKGCCSFALGDCITLLLSLFYEYLEFSIFFFRDKTAFCKKFPFLKLYRHFRFFKSIFVSFSIFLVYLVINKFLKALRRRTFLENYSEEK